MIMASKKVLTQVKKAMQLIEKEHWNIDDAIEAAYTSINDEITLEEFTAMVDREDGWTYA
jgi:hypothetical protein